MWGKGLQIVHEPLNLPARLQGSVLMCTVFHNLHQNLKMDYKPKRLGSIGVDSSSGVNTCEFCTDSIASCGIHG